MAFYRLLAALSLTLLAAAPVRADPKTSGPTLAEVQEAASGLRTRIGQLQQAADNSPTVSENTLSQLEAAQKNLQEADKQIAIAQSDRQWKDRDRALVNAMGSIEDGFRNTLRAGEGLDIGGPDGGPETPTPSGDGPEQGIKALDSPGSLPTIPEVGRIERSTLESGRPPGPATAVRAGVGAAPSAAAFPTGTAPSSSAAGDSGSPSRSLSGGDSPTGRASSASLEAPAAGSRPAGRGGPAGEALVRPRDEAAGEALARKVESLMRQAREAMAAGRFWDAFRLLNSLLDLDPSNTAAYALRAAVRERLGERAGALEDLARAADLDPRYREAHERAAAGGKIYPAGEDDASFLDRLLAGRLPSAPWLPWAAGALSAAALAAGWSLARGRRNLAPAAGVADRGRGRYRLVRVIGHGGMGDVYEAEDTVMGRTVAVKRISPALLAAGSAARRRLIREARAVAALSHPSIVGIYDVVEDGEDLQIVFEFVHGKTLHQIIAEEHRLPLVRAVEILSPVCSAVEHAHSQGLAHRDIKPGNIMVSEEGGVKLMDFGLAGAFSAPPPDAPGTAASLTLGTATKAAGTPWYMAPETAREEVGAAGDIYSLGICLYEMVTGSVPFDDPDDLLEKKLKMDFIPASRRTPGLPPALDEAVEAALRADPARRLQRPAELLSLIQGAST